MNFARALLFVFYILSYLCNALKIERGFQKFDFNFVEQKTKRVVNFTKSMFEDEKISFTIWCDSNTKNVEETFDLDISISMHPCHVPRENATLTMGTGVSKIQCQKHIKITQAILDGLVFPTLPPPVSTTEKPTTKLPTTTTTEKPRRRRAAQEDDEPLKSTQETTSKSTQETTSKSTQETTSKSTETAEPPTEAAKTTPDIKPTSPPKTKKKANTVDKGALGQNTLPAVKRRGLYLLELNFSGKNAKFQVKISARREGGYLSVMNWPLLPFYGVMSLVYLLFAIAWFIMSCMNWRDLLRVQFWIGGVIGIGMLENALFYTEYRNINSSGEPNGLLYFAEFVSCLKRTLARTLVLIVSMGFGIVKPRLGQMLNKILAVGSLYLLISTVEGCIRVHDQSTVPSKTQMYALIPLTILDVAICWWVFTSLVQTTRTLNIRKNVVKLTLYRHFTNTLIFTVIASLAYMIWMIKQVRYTECISVGTIWLQESLWPFLFALILAVIMLLWRPSINNQRYAFTPLEVGGSSDDEDDITLSDAFEGMKMRNKSESNGVVKNRNRAEEDLKWVEENIPSVPSTLLPTIDSDEEILTTKFEISKMN